ncbi:MFS transporter [Caldimonas brevitalea]|uniref:MFS transporter n=1 Tax=Caldimonas brevitalea TaxID=413882 RepID=A0A0G3BRG0_9BURK|nr:MFS transporter [Caldimonas brevitalea]AKJ29135.1 MFS transporter [Caldimonas brevitalea]
MSETTSLPDGTRSAAAPDRSFHWLLAGSLLSMLGDQFTLIALPWLVLRMTGDTLMLGLVLGVMSVPRALFMLVGGAMVDRYSPKRVLMWTKHVSTVLLLVLAAVVYSGTPQPWMIYTLAFGLGLASAFSIPSGTSILPRVVPPQRLQAANGVLLGLRQLSMFVGPLLAGGLIVVFGDGERDRVSDAQGLAAAFAFDALTFIVSAWTLAQVRTIQPPREPGAAAGQAVLASVVAGLRHCWGDRELRACYLYWGAVALLIMGPVHIALPLLADTRPGLGAAAFGVLVGSHGAGTLLGMAVAALKPRWRVRNLGITLLLADATVGLLFMPMGHIAALWQGAALLLAIGTLGGYLQVAIFTWIQHRVPASLLGRAMSLFMFIFLGLVPLSAAVTGALLRHIALADLFVGSGVVLVGLVALALAVSPLRHLRDAPVAAPR